MILNYPDFSKLILMGSDVNDLQLDAVISQDGKPLAYYISFSTEEYIVGEKELR